MKLSKIDNISNINKIFKIDGITNINKISKTDKIKLSQEYQYNL